MSLPFCNNLRKGDPVQYQGRRGVVASQPRESSALTQVLFDGIKSPRYLPVLDLRLLIDGVPEDVPPCDGVPPGAKPRAANTSPIAPGTLRQEIRALINRHGSDLTPYATAGILESIKLEILRL